MRFTKSIAEHMVTLIPRSRCSWSNLRLTAIGRLPSLALALPPATALARRTMREVWFPEIGSTPCPVHWRDGLRAGETLAGPAIVEAMDSTIVVPPGWIGSVDGKGYIRLRRR
jgi:N-methylhydantoinase A